jgi:hypothetical protein
MARSKGSIVRLTADAKENYSEHAWINQPLRITHVATRYMPSKEFFARGKPDGYHPLYDTGVTPQPLYDLETLDGEDIPCSLYGWELRSA